ncbi:MAG: 30S ribosomal protein S12 methylthiotransferase RimO [Oscillospiraceae bacterium]|nr:30S ribosomal protein S12 methylthiotransferase RimO [Oscillospiraceae bacterium]
MKVAVVSLGCSKNLVDAEQMLGLLNLANFDLVEDEEDANVIIVNTCCFIESAKEESIASILEMAEYKKSGNCQILIVSGCMAQRYKQEVIDNIPEVDAVVGTGQYDKIADIIAHSLHSNIANKVNCDEQIINQDALPRIRTTPAYTAYLKIAEGCDNHCTYCVIPSIRGRYTSRKIEDIVREAETMAADGVRELILIAQDTTSYGKDIYGEPKLAELLEKLCEIDGVKWIRLHYCYPELITDKLIEVIAANDQICNYLDIPIQHANDEILRKMNRRANKAQVTALIEKLRARIPDISIRTTVIVGFPGETDEQCAELLEFVKEHKFDRLGAFTYSQEEGTPAAEFDGQIEEDVKLARQDMIMLAQTDISEEINSKKVGKTYSVLVEGYDTIIKQFYGRTYADSIDIDGKVFFASDKKPDEGDFVKVKITDYMEYDLFGQAED